MTTPSTAPGTVLVTGVSRGLGLAIASTLLGEGYTVIGLSRSCSASYSQLLEAHGDRASFSPLDLRDPAAIATTARTLVKERGPIWGLVNNAGVGTDGVLATMHLSDMQAVLDTNLLGPMVLTKFVVRSMLGRKQGRIVNVSSIIAHSGFHGLAVYGASKAGLEGFTRSLAREVGKRNITVNCVAPGYMETDMTAALQGGKLDSVRRRAPLGLPTPDAVAGAVSYLLSPAAGQVTGTVLTVDGGSTA